LNPKKKNVLASLSPFQHQKMLLFISFFAAFLPLFFEKENGRSETEKMKPKG